LGCAEPFFFILRFPGLTDKEQCRGLNCVAKRASDAGEASGTVSMEQHMDQ
jgi:hypothetical protein